MPEASNLISEVALLRELIEGLTARYQDVIHVIEQEHENVRKSDLVSLEKITKSKISLGDDVASLSIKLTQSFELLRNLVHDLQPDKGVKPSDLSGLVDILSSICLEEELEHKVLIHEVNKLKEALQAFVAMKDLYQPKVEMNRYLLEKILKNHQETFRFWQSIAAESEATYGSKGVAKSQSSEPILRVRT